MKATEVVMGKIEYERGFEVLPLPAEPIGVREILNWDTAMEDAKQSINQHAFQYSRTKAIHSHVPEEA